MQVQATPLQRVMLQVLARSLQEGVAQDAVNVVAGGVARDVAQDTVMSGGADGRRTSPREGEDDEEQA